MNNIALICGLIRDEASYNDKLDTLLHWRRDGVIDEIVVSTWIGELAKFPELAERLQTNGVRVVETSEPEAFFKGTTWHQMKSLAFGLEACDPNCAVLRLRGDKVRLTESLRGLLARRRLEPCAPPVGWPAIFKSRIVAVAGIVTQPFFLNDMIFYGMQSDLIKLINFDISFQVGGGLMNVEQLFFLSPFSREFPIFRQFFRVNWGLLHFDFQKNDSRELILGSWHYAFYREAILTWFIILRGYFMMDEDRLPKGKCLEFSDWTLSQFLDINEQKERPGVTFDNSIKTFGFQTLDFVDAVMEGRFKPDDLTVVTSESLDRALDYDRQRHHGHLFMGLDAEALAWAEFTRQYQWGDMRLNHLKAVTEHLWQVHSPPLHIRVPHGD